MDASYTHEYENFELRHWWFVARRRILHEALDRYASLGSANPRWLDVGCGTGVLLDSYPAISNKLGLELDAGSVERARSKGLDVRKVEPRWDFSDFGAFDLITLTDVIEHVEHEHQALDAVRAVLKDGGVVVVTVPALMSLWSGHDVVNHHYRRYTEDTLLPLFPPDQWKILKVSYFSSLLLPMVFVARKLKNIRDKRKPPTEVTHDLKFGSKWADWALMKIFGLEAFWLRFARYPVGSSILLVAQKKPSRADEPVAGARNERRAEAARVGS
jgi:SAM-dependent methyltransferase